MKQIKTRKRSCFSTHKKQKATRKDNKIKKRFFFTYNKEKATRNRFRVKSTKSLQRQKSDEKNKLNFSKTPCFSHTRKESHMQSLQGL